MPKKTQNQVQLIGYVGNDPTLQVLTNGNKKVRLRIATDHAVKNEKGELDYIATWHTIIAWDEVADTVVNNFSKGSHILVEGPIIYRTYDNKQGITCHVTEIYARHCLNLDR
jgi:single-strand DNA-binding protein